MPLNRRHILGAGIAAAACVMTSAAPAQTKKPLVTGHRGAPGYLPEHTRAGYELAIRMGADFIEPDVVATSDGHLIVRHEPLLSLTTDVASRPEFAGRQRTRTLDGIATTDFFTCDFTLAEIKTLRAVQAFADRDHSHDGLYPVLTLQEVLDIAHAGGVGIYPETKHPTFHQALGLPLEDRLLDTLGRAGLTQKSSPVIIQSFEAANLKYLRAKTSVRLMHLIDGSDTDPATGAMILKAPSDKPYDWVAADKPGNNLDQITLAGLQEIATFADIVAPWKRYLITFVNGAPVLNQTLVDNAHACGLDVHTWTLRNDRLDSWYAGNPDTEYQQLFGMGIDGLFSDFADTAVAARNKFMASKS